ncbi:outer membrane lipoprotein-sorting protein [Desulfococcaceae bacterium HSG9]|nr:outer membrane lipoprotein-sorting protein [Desulfococcaceae bacterium HSG9]
MWFRIFLIVAAVWGFSLSGAVAEELTGRSILEEQEKRHVSDNESGEIDMTLIDRKGKESQRQMRVFHLKKDEQSKILIQFLAPANIKGTGLLTWEQGEGKEDDQWLYLPATRSVKRIAGGGKKNQFMGTDLAYEDLRFEDMDSHKYTLMGEETVAGRKCWKIESVPATEDEKKTSGYGKRVIWVGQDNYFNQKIDYYDHNGRHVKTTLFEDIRQMKGQLYRPFKVTVKRIRKKTSTILITKKIELDAPKQDVIFTQNYLKRPIK